MSWVENSAKRMTFAVKRVCWPLCVELDLNGNSSHMPRMWKSCHHANPGARGIGMRQSVMAVTGGLEIP